VNKNWRHAIVLITGIDGFVGTNLYNSLQSRVEIFGLDITKKSDKKCRVYNWDELHKLPDVSTVIHLAGLAHDIKGSADQNDYHDVNVGLTRKIFKHFINSSAQKFIYFSSVKAAADTVHGKILTENIVPDPKTPYGKSKLEAEKYLLYEDLPIDKKLYIFRPAMIHGPGNKGNLNILYRVIKRGVPYPFGAYSNKRSFTSIQNLLFIIETFLEQEIESGIYNVCDDDALSTTEIVDLICNSLDRRTIIWSLPKTFIIAIAKIGDLARLPFDSERLQKLTETYVVSNKKIKLALNIEALPITSSEGLLATLKSFHS
jgi:nucleoside-diphosphate-sugar epimerase